MAKAKNSGPTKSNLPAKTDDKGKGMRVLEGNFDKYANQGMEGTDRDSFAVPFLIILQSGSPQCKKADPAYNEDAEEGMIYNTVTGTLYDGDEGIVVIPCAFQRRFVQWADRDAGGGAGGAGFRGEHMPGSNIVNSGIIDPDGRLRVDDATDNKGNHIADLLVDTRNHFVIIETEDGLVEMAIVSMSSTQVKKSKAWMSRMQALKFKDKSGRLQTPPTFAMSYKLTTVPESNDQGSWFGWKVEPHEPVDTDSPIFEAAEAFNRTVNEGGARPAERVFDNE